MFKGKRRGEEGGLVRLRERVEGKARQRIREPEEDETQGEGQ